jgi:cyclopropane-fatty-acyl-phospholipid synthase
LHQAFLNSGEFTRVFTETTSHDYARTLYHWREKLEQAAIRFHPEIVRKYRYYLAYCQAGFHTEMLHVSRVVFEKKKF